MKQLLCLVLSIGMLGSQVQARGAVPFSATIDTQVAPAGPCGPTCLMLNISGSGQALHLGRTTMDGPSQIDFATGGQSGTSTFTAADGSTLTIAFDGSFIPGAGPGDATFSGAWTVTSGTARFASVSGGGSYHGSASGPAGVLIMEGSISLR
jgi:hypothetical protein